MIARANFFHFSATKGSGQYAYLEKKKTCDLSRPGRYREPPTWKPMMKRRSFLPLQRCLNGAKIRSMKICISFWGQEARNLNTTARLTPTPARPPLPVPVSLCILPYKSLGIRNKTACVTYIQSESVKVDIGRVEVPNVGSSAEKKEQNLPSGGQIYLIKEKQNIEQFATKVFSN